MQQVSRWRDWHDFCMLLDVVLPMCAVCVSFTRKKHSDVVCFRFVIIRGSPLFKDNTRRAGTDDENEILATYTTLVSILREKNR